MNYIQISYILGLYLGVLLISSIVVLIEYFQMRKELNTIRLFFNDKALHNDYAKYKEDRSEAVKIMKRFGKDW